MDVYSHAASGAAAGLVLGLCRRRGVFLSRRLTVLACTIGAVLPDADAITYGFGDWGIAAYKGNHWYSHHQFFHVNYDVALVNPGAFGMGYRDYKRSYAVIDTKTWDIVFSKVLV